MWMQAFTQISLHLTKMPRSKDYSRKIISKIFLEGYKNWFFMTFREGEQCSDGMEKNLQSA